MTKDALGEKKVVNYTLSVAKLNPNFPPQTRLPVKNERKPLAEQYSWEARDP